MNEYDPDRNSTPMLSPLQCTAGVFALVAGAVCLGLLGSVTEFLDLAEVCDADNCFIDSRPWARRHSGALSVLGAAVAAVVVCLVVDRVRQAGLGTAGIR